MHYVQILCRKQKETTKRDNPLSVLNPLSDLTARSVLDAVGTGGQINLTIVVTFTNQFSSERLIMLHRQILKIARQAGAANVAATFYDYESETSWSFQGNHWFHAASTIKVAILVSIFQCVSEDRLSFDSNVPVRNRFLSVVDGKPYRISRERDASKIVHDAIGKTLKIRELAYHMIVTSSNLATNLLLDLAGVERTNQILRDLGVSGIELIRGVEDEKAFACGINNRVTARGLLQLFRIIQDRKISSNDTSQQMLDILYEQEFRSGIPAGIPDDVKEKARFAHKTGEISTVSHDAGLIFLPDRKPYAVAILTEWPVEVTSGRNETIASISNAIYHHITVCNSGVHLKGRPVAA